MTNIIISKFGGSTVSDSEGVRRAAEIIKSLPSRRFVIISAPGKNSGDTGITDMLFMLHSNFANKECCDDLLAEISERFMRIIKALGIHYDIESEIASLKKDLASGKNADYIASRGELIMSGIFASYLGWEFIDASEIIFFNRDGTVNEPKTFAASRKKLLNTNHAVIPGFYGSLPDGGIKTFPRKGGDITAGLIARALDAGMLEKWNMKTEIFSADPSVVNDPAVIRNITYSEALELNYIGIKTIHDDVIMQLRNSGIPVSIKSTLKPDDEGTLITSALPNDVKRNTAVCIAGRSSFKIIHIEKFRVNHICGFGEKLLGIFARYRIACEHCLSGIHKMSVVLKTPAFDLKRREILSEIERELKTDSVTVEDNLSLIAVIGKGMGTTKGTFEKVFCALANADIKVRMIDQGSDDLNIILGVHDEDYHKAVNALYANMIVPEGD